MIEPVPFFVLIGRGMRLEVCHGFHSITLLAVVNTKLLETKKFPGIPEIFISDRETNIPKHTFIEKEILILVIGFAVRL